MKIKVENSINIKEFIIWLSKYAPAHPNQVRIVLRMVSFILGISSTIMVLGYGKNAESLVLIINALKQ